MKKFILSAIALLGLLAPSAYSAEVLASRHIANKATDLSSILENTTTDENGDTNIQGIPSLGALIKPYLLAKVIGADDLALDALKDQKSVDALNRLFKKIDEAAVEFEVGPEVLMEVSGVSIYTGPDATRIEIRVAADTRADSFFMLEILINAASQHIDIEESFQDHP